MEEPKKIPLHDLSKPRTLVLLHYKSKRLSIPLYELCLSITEMLKHNIDKFEQTILSKDANWEKKAKTKMVCFQTLKKSENAPIKDADLKMDVLLSWSRVATAEQSILFDVSVFYKFMEIEPFSVQLRLCAPIDSQLRPYELKHPSNPPHQFHPEVTVLRVLSQTALYNRYLCRDRTDGHFYSLTVYTKGSKCGRRQADAWDRIIAKQKQEKQNEPKQLLKQLAIRPAARLYVIPNIRTDPKDQYCVVITPYHCKGTLFSRYLESHSCLKPTPALCLSYLCQLVKLVSDLHRNVNIFHRQITPFNIEVDHSDGVHLVNYAATLPCFDKAIDQGIQYSDASRPPRPLITFQSPSMGVHGSLNVNPARVGQQLKPSSQNSKVRQQTFRTNINLMLQCLYSSSRVKRHFMTWANILHLRLGVGRDTAIQLIIIAQVTFKSNTFIVGIMIKELCQRNFEVDPLLDRLTEQLTSSTLSTRLSAVEEILKIGGLKREFNLQIAQIKLGEPLLPTSVGEAADLKPNCIETEFILSVFERETLSVTRHQEPLKPIRLKSKDTSKKSLSKNHSDLQTSKLQHHTSKPKKSTSKGKEVSSKSLSRSNLKEPSPAPSPAKPKSKSKSRTKISLDRNAVLSPKKVLKPK